MVRVHKVLAFGVITALGATSIFAHGIKKPAPQIQGFWSTRVTIQDCVSGAPLTPFPSPGLITFHAHGTVSESAPAPPNTMRGPAQGVWRRVGRNAFAELLIFQSFDVTGTYLGTLVVNAVATVADDSLTYQAQGTFELKDPAGTVLSRGCSAVTATRNQ